MQACAAVLIEQNDKLLELTKNAGNLPNIILKNLKDTLSITVGLLDRVGSYKPNSEISNEEISRICQRIGNLVVNVEMINIQIKTYNKGEENK
jgi:hypothetical protein